MTTDIALRNPASLDSALCSVESTMPWLRSWKATDPVPESAVAALPEAIATADAACRPATPEEFAVAMARFVGWIQRARLYRFSDDEAEASREAKEITQDFRLTLSDLPADLLRLGIVAVMQTHDFNVLPKPSAVRAAVAEEIERRRDLQRRLKTAHFIAVKIGRVQADPYRVERTPEQIAAVERDAAEAKRVLAEAVPQTIPAEADDMKPDTSDYLGAVRRVAEETKGRRLIPKPWDHPVTPTVTAAE